MSQQFDDKQFFEILLGMERTKVEHHRGTSPDDYLYDQAEKVRQGTFPGTVHVTYQGKEYGPVTATWGPLDGSKEKMTALIRTDQGVWMKLWYWDRDVVSQQSNQEAQ